MIRVMRWRVRAHAEPAAWWISSWSRTRRQRGEIWLGLDATDDPLHGRQEGRFFHGYYRCYCYLPLYTFCGEHLLYAA